MHLYLTPLVMVLRSTSPGEVLARANQTNATITTNTEIGTPTRIIQETALLPDGATPASLGFDSETEFSLALHRV